MKPRNRIIDYVTKYSGITEKMLENVDVRVEDVQVRFIPFFFTLLKYSFITVITHLFTFERTIHFQVTLSHMKELRAQLTIVLITLKGTSVYFLNVSASFAYSMHSLC